VTSCKNDLTNKLVTQLGLIDEKRGSKISWDWPYKVSTVEFVKHAPAYLESIEAAIVLI
jgi:hypothetical protein